MTLPSTSDTDYPTLFESERGTLLALLEGLAADDWSRPTPCPGWTVLDLAAHLLGDDLGLLARQRDHHAGLVPPPDAAGEAGFARWLDNIQDAWVRAARRLSPRLTIDLLAWTTPQALALFRSQDPQARDALVSWASDQPVPRWLDHARELSEHWIHRQQLLQSLNRPAELTTPAAAAVINALRWAYPHHLTQLRRPAGYTISILIDGPVERAWHLQSDGSRWEFADEPSVPAATRLHVTSDQFWRLLTNNLPPAQQARLDARGEAEVIHALTRTRAIIGVPN